MVSAPEMFNYQNFSLNCIQCGTCYTKDNIHIMECIGITEAVYEAARKYQELNLTDDEVAIFRAFVIFDPSKFCLFRFMLCTGENVFV